MILITLALIAGFLTTSVFFYGGQLVLHWLEIPDSPQAIDCPASPILKLIHASALEGDATSGALKSPGSSVQLATLDSAGSIIE